MAEKSRLKTIIEEVFKIDRKTITFVNEDNHYRIKVGNNTIFSLSYDEDTYCCGILPLGDTVYNGFIDGVNALDILNLDINLRNEYYVLCMKQMYILAASDVENGNLAKGLATWTHVNDNPVVLALQSEYNDETMLWKLVNTFYNPNSQNTVCLFTADIN